MKKILALALALVLVMSLATTAFAASMDEETGLPLVTIKAPQGSEHVFDVYQIFVGEYHYDEVKKEESLSNVLWGKNGKGTFKEAVSDTVLKKLSAASTETVDRTKFDVIGEYVELESEPIGQVTAAAPLQVPTGYYLFVDMGHGGAGTSADGEGLSFYIVSVAGDVTLKLKNKEVTSTKKVLDDEAPNNYLNDSADYDIGDKVPFQLKTVIAADYNNYIYGYKLTFHDTMSEGLTFNEDSVVVKADGNLIAKSNYTVITKKDEMQDKDCTFEIHFANLKGVSEVAANTTLTVDYTATLNENAKIGKAGNPNTSHVTFTNRPTDKQFGENGETPDDKVTVFTYKLIVNKYANSVGEDNKLAGAQFSLTKGNDTYTATVNDDGDTFTFTGLDAGVYILKETVTPAGYNTMKPVTITITAEHSENADDPELVKLAATPADEITHNVTDGSISINIVNHSGASLPDTGSIGTHIFYLFGTVLTLGAALMLITKKRVNNI